jgi:hypothetical protein
MTPDELTGATTSRVRRLHLPSDAVRERSAPAGWRCRLQGGFIDHYLIKVIHPLGLTHGMQIGLGVLALLLAIIGYWGFVRRHGWFRAWRRPLADGTRPEHRNIRHRHQPAVRPQQHVP